MSFAIIFSMAFIDNPSMVHVSRLTVQKYLYLFDYKEFFLETYFSFIDTNTKTNISTSCRWSSSEFLC